MRSALRRCGPDLQRIPSPSPRDIWYNAMRYQPHLTPTKMLSPFLSSDLQKVLADDDGTPEVHARRVDPHLLGHARILGGHEVRKHQGFDAGRLRDTTGVFGR